MEIMKGRRHELNLDPGFNPLDPAQVSDPKCWITGEAAEVLNQAMVNKIGMLRRAPVFQNSDLDISDQVETDLVTGKYRLK